jgi:hypothetical protein
MAAGLSPLPWSGTAKQIVLPPSLNVTVPVGACPVTLAVKVTLSSDFDALSSEVRFTTEQRRPA